MRPEAAHELNTALVPRMNQPAARAQLTPFIGQPLSRKLIAEVEAAIARYYRQQGYPFVSISTPPQPISGGVLQVRVIEFHAGDVKVTGVDPDTAQTVRGGVRLQTGQPIDAVQLEQDLDWLNRYPYRHTEAVFAPGDDLGASNLALQTTLSKPWQVYAGYANSGSPSTGWDRYFMGVQAGGLLVPGTVFSYQFTASPDFFDDHGDAFGELEHPEYASHGARASIPIGDRQELEFTFDHVETNVADTVFGVQFAVRQETGEFSFGYRGSVSNFVRFPGDIFAGVEIKSERRISYFSGLEAVNNSIDVYQGYLGWENAWSDLTGRNDLTLTVHASPGGVDGHNSLAALALFSNYRIVAADYAYDDLQFSRTTRLPANWSLVNSLIGQYAGTALPDTEQMGVGGSDLVRGYTLDDGAYDSAIVSRNELRAPSLALLGRAGPVPDQLAPFAFFDAGYGTSHNVAVKADLASVGVGADYYLGGRLSATATVGRALTDGVETRNGDWLLQSRVTLSF